MSILQLQEMSVLLQTSFGDIIIDLYTQKAPNTCLSFLKLCKTKHYNNTLFAQVNKNYVAKVKPENPTNIWKQTGINMPHFKDQIDLEKKFNEVGLVATANTGPNLNTSQFFITLTKANLNSLSGKHTIFGKVEEGLDVLRKINDTYTDSQYRPQMNIRILHTFVIDDPFPDVQNMTIPSRSPSPIKNSERLQAIQHLQMLEKCRSQNQIIEATREQKAKKQAMTLQILGDLPDANLKPPENILFICKLNPITQEKDLEVIFSRFGPIKSVQIVRDWKTGQSLQYGFVEFDNINSCEEAYLKMNNVIIDDRRIQVDFSQSVSKLLHRNKNVGIVNKPRYGEPQDLKRQLLPKSFTGGKDTRQKYDYIIPNASQRHGVPKEIQKERQTGIKQKIEQFISQQKKKYSRERQRKRKHQRSRSRSNSLPKKQKQKHRRRSDSSERERHKLKEKKNRKDRRSSSRSHQ